MPYGGSPAATHERHADEVLDVEVEDVPPVEMVEDRRVRLGRDPVQPPDLVVLAPRALRDLETVLLVDRLGNELRICHRAAPPSPVGDRAQSETSPPSAASKRGRRPSSRARRVRRAAPPGSAASAARRPARRRRGGRPARAPSSRSFAIRSSAKSGANPFDDGMRGVHAGEREARAQHAGVAGRRGEELVERAGVDPLAHGDRTGLRERRHRRAGDEVVAELRRLAGAVAADADDEPRRAIVEERLRAARRPPRRRRP